MGEYKVEQKHFYQRPYLFSIFVLDQSNFQVLHYVNQRAQLAEYHESKQEWSLSISSQYEKHNQANEHYSIHQKLPFQILICDLCDFSQLIFLVVQMYKELRSDF